MTSSDESDDFARHNFVVLPTEASLSMSGLNDISTLSAEIRTRKRKFDAALYSIDQAFTSFDSITPPSQDPPSKKATVPKSLFSTLAKYGITSKPSKDTNEDQLAKTAPHLARILSRKAARSRLANPFKRPNPPPALPQINITDENITSIYRPLSTPAFLARLSTFKLSTYANKPALIDSVAAARCGWTNNGRDRLTCGVCTASWVVMSRDGMKSKEAAERLLEQQVKGLIEMHKESCPWRINQCDASVYRIPLKASSIMVKEIRDTARGLNSLLSEVEIKHPLTVAQMNALRIVVNSISDGGGEDSGPRDVILDPPIITALFGWSLVPPTMPHSSTPSLSQQSLDKIRWASSVPLQSQPVVSDPAGEDFLARSSPSPLRSTSQAILLCKLCQRRIGLWAFAPPTPLPSSTSIDTESLENVVPPMKTQRSLDPLREHRSHCPYVVRSSVPSVTPGGAPEVEGWRTVLSMVIRRTSMDSASEPGIAEVDGIKEMMQNVKSRGGRDLLKYVKGLLA